MKPESLWRQPNLALLFSVSLASVLMIGSDVVAAQQYPAPSYGQNPSWQPTLPNRGQYAPAPQDQYPQPQQENYPQQDMNYAPSGPDAYPAQGYAPAQPQAPLNVQQLEQLVAPIALYPDTLVAQVLAAATYPAQVVDADHWRQAQGYVSPEAIVDGADAQTWDPSVKALTAFPQVLAELDQNLRWTTALGNAYYNQPQDVLDVVQVMRQRAQSAGNLQSTPQETMTYDAGYIQLAPTDPQVVYLPSYDPWNSYGQPISPYPGFSLLGALGQVGSFLGSSLLHYGPGIAMAAFNHTPWGLLSWGLNWLEHAVLFHQSPFSSHSTTVADWGLPHGGPRAHFGRGDGYLALASGTYRPQGYIAHGYGDSNTFTHMPGQRFEPTQRSPVRAATPGFDRRPVQNGYRDYQAPTAGYTRPTQPAGQGKWNRSQPMQPITRPQQAVNGSFPEYGQRYIEGNPQGNQPFGSSYAPRSRQGYEPRSSQMYGNTVQSRPEQVFRAPQPVFRNRNQGRDYGSRSFDGSREHGFDGYSSMQHKQSSSHGFGGGHEPKMPKAPKSFKSEKGFGGGHPRGGGIFGGHGGGHHR